MSTLNESGVVEPGNTPYRLKRALGSAIDRRFSALLTGVQLGQLSLTWPDGHTTVHGNRSEDNSQNASLTLHNFKPIRQLMLGGENGFAESYLRGEWSTDNLLDLFSLIMRNEATLLPSVRANWVARLMNMTNHLMNRNSRRGSQRNIAYHYDLGNGFYRLWLDSCMNYSSALFESDDQSLKDAQANKMARVVEMLSPSDSASVLEIGCGWGSMAHTLASHSGCHVHGISLSSEQLEHAREHNAQPGIAPSGAQGSVEFVHQDYRSVTGQYDHIVSIEMFEAVGEQYWTTYFDKLAELLQPDGTAVLQVITLDEDRYEGYRSSPDFIQRYIFPGGMLPTRSHLQRLADEAGFDIEESDWFGHSYARTLAGWRERFEAANADVLAQGFDDRFVRMWRYYLVYCETGFSIGTTDVGMLKLRRR